MNLYEFPYEASLKTWNFERLERRNFFVVLRVNLA
jgi:hypothetical protein